MKDGVRSSSDHCDNHNGGHTPFAGAVPGSCMSPPLRSLSEFLLSPACKLIIAIGWTGRQRNKPRRHGRPILASLGSLDGALTEVPRQFCLGNCKVWELSPPVEFLHTTNLCLTRKSARSPRLHMFFERSASSRAYREVV